MSNSSSASSLSPSNSISLIRLDELSSFGATKQSRLPALIKLNHNQHDQHQPGKQAPSSMPTYSGSQLEKTPAFEDKQASGSLPVDLLSQSIRMSNQLESIEISDKENIEQARAPNELGSGPAADVEDFQVVDMEPVSGQDENLVLGPSLPQVPEGSRKQRDKSINGASSELRQQLHSLDKNSLQALQSSQLGDSLIEMIINLRNENQNLIRALETNNEYVKQRLGEFKKAQEEAKKREAQFALEKAEFEHQNRKLQRQNGVLSERLKSMEAKLKDMKLEVSESLNAAHSSKASSLRGENNLYPELGEHDSFGNSALLATSSGDNQATTMQIDAASGELLNQGDRPPRAASDPSAPPMDCSVNEPQQDMAARMASMSQKELEKHFDAEKTKFYALDDPMKQCDKLEQQLNEIGKRDYEICLLQQQLNIYRQDFRLERMANLEAKIQIEKLKNDIDKLCLERLQQRQQNATRAKEVDAEAAGGSGAGYLPRNSAGRFDPTGAADALLAVGGKLGHQLTRRAAKSAAKAAKYAAKQAHREERAAAAAARAAAYASAASSSNPNAQQPAGFGQPGDGEVPGQYRHGHQHHHRHSGRRHSSSKPGIRSEVVSDLLSTANRAMLTGYKMASTHVNLALDKLSQFEQQQASALDKNKQQAAPGGDATPRPSAPAQQPPSID